MVKLVRIEPFSSESSSHIILLHGLNGNPTTTWQFPGQTTSSWPNWLAEDNPSLAVWAVGYDAAISRWKGHAMHLTDRAQSILSLLLARDEFKTGEIALIGHSLGGLVIKQVIRTAESVGHQDEVAASFLRRVRKVGFLGTPHQGAGLATLADRLRIFAWPSDATSSLLRNDPHLRDLTRWYREWASRRATLHLILSETRRSHRFFLVVPPDSADPGLLSRPIPIDADHSDVCKAESRDSAVYIQIRSFIARDSLPLSASAFAGNVQNPKASELSDLSLAVSDATTAVMGLKSAVDSISVRPSSAAHLVDAHVLFDLTRIGQRRAFLSPEELVSSIRALVEKVSHEEYAFASREVRDQAFAVCARWLAFTQPDEAATILASVKAKDSELAAIASGVLSAAKSDLSGALATLSRLNTPGARGAAYLCVRSKGSYADAKKWLADTGYPIESLDIHARAVLANTALETSDYEQADLAISTFKDEDFASSPLALLAAGMSALMATVPLELRSSVAHQLPINPLRFPLKGDSVGFEFRRIAIQRFDCLRVAAESLSLQELALRAGELSLWLRLLDPQLAPGARKELGTSVLSPGALVHRLPLVIAAGIPVDHALVERELDRQTAIEGGVSPAIAMARVALLMSIPTAAEAGCYLERHKSDLIKVVNRGFIASVEIDVLVQLGQKARAIEVLDQAKADGISPDEEQRLRHIVESSEVADSINDLLREYLQDKTIPKLERLLHAYEDAGEWRAAAEYSSLLLERTDDVMVARRNVVALYNVGRLDDLMKVYSAYPAMAEGHDRIGLLRARAQYELGDLHGAKETLNLLHDYSGSSEYRRLKADIAVTSGDWEALQELAEAEWRSRGKRTPQELLRMGTLAQMVGVARGHELVKEAASLAADDATILMGCYQAATTGGWEGSEVVHGWLTTAFALSEGKPNAPVGKMSMDDLLSRQPVWQEHQRKTFDQLAAGELPSFIAAEALNRTLLSMTLMPALINQDERDPRKRSNLGAFSGARVALTTDAKVLAFDPSALITAEMLEILNVCIGSFDGIVIPHATFGWLLAEQAKVLFHQPSRVAAAKELRRLVDQKLLQSFAGVTKPSHSLVVEAGEALAQLLAEASSKAHGDENQRLVVKGGPVYKPSSFMKELADLAEYLPFICSCEDVVEKLAHSGIISADEAASACSALSVRETRLTEKRTIEDGAVLYLDDVAAAHLEFVGLLSKIHRAKVTVVLSPSELAEADELITYDAQASRMVLILQRLRAHLRHGMDAGRVRLGVAVRSASGSSRKSEAEHPTMALLRLGAVSDAGVCDDRFVNQLSKMSDGTHDAPLLTTLDLLDELVRRGAIAPQVRKRSMTTLRASGYILIPVVEGELRELVEAAAVLNGQIVETLELRAIRESVLRVRMSNVLQSPKELPWLQGLLKSALHVLKHQWTSGSAVEAAAAKSDWLLELSDLRGWAHRVWPDEATTTIQAANWLLLLATAAVGMESPAKENYWNWLDQRLLRAAQSDTPKIFEQLVQLTEARVADIVKISEDEPERDSHD